MDYLAYLDTIWAYLPYLMYAFVFLTLLPKSVRRIKAYAAAEYAANALKYHRCYSPELCCHLLIDERPEQHDQPKVRTRKAVTRVYPKRQSAGSLRSPLSSDITQTTTAAAAAAAAAKTTTIRRQVQPAAIQTRTNVNLMAKMFENGAASGTSSAPPRKVNPVPPTIMAELPLMPGEAEFGYNIGQTKRSPIDIYFQESIENSVNLLNQQQKQQKQQQQQQQEERPESGTTGGGQDSWSSEPIIVQRRIRNVPGNLNYAGTSATPSTASPAASSPRSSSPHHSSSPTPSPVRCAAPPLILKSSLEDIFAAIARNAEKNEPFIYAGCSTLSPVTSIDDILSQRRLSRPLSAYSISDLLAEDAAAPAIDDAYVERIECLQRY